MTEYTLDIILFEISQHSRPSACPPMHHPQSCLWALQHVLIVLMFAGRTGSMAPWPRTALRQRSCVIHARRAAHHRLISGLVGLHTTNLPPTLPTHGPNSPVQTLLASP